MGVRIPKTTYGEIYRRYTEEKQTQKEIAKDFNCTTGRISQIIKEFRQQQQETV